MRILVCCDDIPEPTIHGGRLAMRNEIRALRSAGHEVYVLAFHREQLTDEVGEANRTLLDAFLSQRRISFARSLLRNPLLPYQVSSRLPTRPTEAKARTWNPQVILCHHEWTLPAALRIRGSNETPIVLRVHNDELKYYADFFRHARGTRAAYLFLEYQRIRLYLRRARSYPVAEAVFMSQDDLPSIWGHIPSKVVPPAMFDDGVRLRQVTGGQNKIVFVGSLDMAHTVSGLEWFIRSVWPMIVRMVPRATFVVAGRRPPERLRQLVHASDGVGLIVNPEVLDPIYGAARVFVNPVFAGSGVNLKLGTPAAMGIPIVTTSVGARGLDSMRPEFMVADTADEFAQSCISLMTDDGTWLGKSRGLAVAATAYSPSAVGKMMSDILVRHASSEQRA